MKINDVIKSFNLSLNRLRGNKNNNTHIIHTVDIIKVDETTKKFIISIYLVDDTDGSSQLIYRSVHTREWTLQETDRAIDELFVNVLSDLIILFKVFGVDMANGTYKSQYQFENIY